MFACVDKSEIACAMRPFSTSGTVHNVWALGVSSLNYRQLHAEAGYFADPFTN